MMPTAVATRPNGELRASPTVELRQYALKPGERETLIGVFDGRLIEGQEEAGMTIIGQFRDLDRPDMFVWLRGFDGMAARKKALTNFYEGPVWAANRDAANATMISSDDVLLLKPTGPAAGFDLSGSPRAVLPDHEKPNDENRLGGVVVVRIYHLRPGAETEFADRFEAEAAPVARKFGARLLAAFVTEHTENNFPRLPVRSENVFISVTGFDSAETHARHAAALDASPQWQALVQASQADRTKPSETLRLSPTSRSRLG